MAKITATQPVERMFTIEVTTQELQQIARGLYKDKTKTGVSPDGDDNNEIYGAVTDFMNEHDIREL